MNKEIEKLFEKYRHKGILIDTNLLLVYLIGSSVNADFIPHFKRTKKYTKEDYCLLSDIIEKHFNLIVTTPHIITETSNLSNSLEDKYKLRFSKNFEQYIIKAAEYYTESKIVVKSTEFRKFGLADAAIFHILNHKYLLLTDDFPLCQYVISKKGDAVNFNHIRLLNWK